jgi:type IX secretion system PorP/SprF family membrane protein
MMMKNKIIILMVLISSVHLYGQQLPQFSLRAYDIMNYNPAVAGSRANQEIKLHHRSQWVGFENAPKSNILSFNASIKDNIGLGGSVYYDSQVTTKNFGANLMYSYHLLFNKFNISLGASAGIQQYQFNTSKLTPFDEYDPLITGEVVRTNWIPNLGGGVFMYNWNYYLGSSFSYYIPTKFSEDIDGKTSPAFCYYFMGGYNFHLSKDFTLLGQAFLAGQPTNTQFELGIKGQYLESFILGAAYRPNDAVVLSTGIKIFKSILFVYSYDFVISNLRNYNSGSHEIVISYEFNRNKPQYYKDKNRVYKKITWN